MKNDYFKSKKHIDNAKNALKKGNEKLKLLKEIRVKAYYENPTLCLCCEKPISYEKKAENKYCSRSCNAKHNNPTKGKERNIETRIKISNSLGGSGEVGKTGKNRKIKEKSKDELLMSTSELKSKRMKQFFDNNPEARKNLSEISKKRVCTEETKKKLKENMRIRIERGEHKGWAKRNKPSYPELFFMKVLQENNLIYEYEKKVGIYFIDFAFNNKKIALEIDGKQHLLPERKKKDEEKDKYLINCDWKVHRILWKNINKPENSDYIKNEIQKFIEFYNSIKNIE